MCRSVVLEPRQGAAWDSRAAGVRGSPVHAVGEVMPKKPAKSGPKNLPVRITGRATVPAYKRGKVEKAVSDIGKAVRRVPSDLAKGGETVHGAVDTLKDRARRVRKG